MDRQRLAAGALANIARRLTLERDTLRKDPSHESGRDNSLPLIEALLKSTLTDFQTSGLPIDSADFATLSRRLANEGPVFAYVTLKEVSSMLLTTLEYGAIPHQSSFATLPDSTVPKFLRGLWLCVVDRSGTLLSVKDLPNNHVECVKALLQISTSFTKYSAGFPEHLVQSALDEFVAIEDQIDTVVPPASLISVARSIITASMRKVFNRDGVRHFVDLSLRDIYPKHGPGAVCTGERAEQKWDFKRVFTNAHRVYPWYDFFVAGGPSEVRERMRWYIDLERKPYAMSKTIPVPKDAGSVRLISIEQLENQFLQQGQLALLMDWVQSHPLTRGRINFVDQTINQQFAIQGSITGQFATLDLSSASDRLSEKLVADLFSGDPVAENVYRYLSATRAAGTVLPDGRTVWFKKFAPMGSATTFPVQSLVFFALTAAAISIAHDWPFAKVCNWIRVYGDDIICPSTDADVVADALESCGLKVNRKKSFSRGEFRESCGVYAYKGNVVTPIRFKTSFPRQRGDGRGIGSWLDYAHACEVAGLPNTAEVIYTTIERLTGSLPYGLTGCGYFCRRASSIADLARDTIPPHQYRWNDSLQRLEIKALGLAVRHRPVAFSSGWQRLLRNLLVDQSQSDPSTAVEPRSARTKAGWHPVL